MLDFFGGPGWRQPGPEVVAARQLGFLVARGGDEASTLEQLRRSAGAEFQQALDEIELLLDGKARTDDAGMIGQVVTGARSAGANPGAVLGQLLPLREEMRLISARLLHQLRDRAGYVQLLAISGLLVSALWVKYVWPVLETYFRGAGVEMPGPGQSLLEAGFLGLPLAFGIVALLAVVLQLIARKQGQSIRALQPWRFLTMSRRLRDAGNTRLAAACCAGLTAAGLEPGQALQQTARTLGDSLPPGFERDTAIAAAVGTLPEELQHQAQAATEAIAHEATRSGRWAYGVLKLLLFALIAAAVISFYQPIFGLGSVTVE